MSYRVLRLASLLGILMLSKQALAAGATGPAGLQGLTEVLLQITIYPYIGVVLAFLIYTVTKKLWVFMLIPFFYWGLSSFFPLVPRPALEESLVYDSLVMVWLYLPHIIATVLVYFIYFRLKRVWIFVWVPVVGWIVQLITLSPMIQLINRLL